MFRQSRRTRVTVVGVIGLLIMAGLMLALSHPAPTLAAGTTEVEAANNPHQGSIIPLKQAGEEDAAGPHSGDDIHAPVSSTLLDFALPGTQPGGIVPPLGPATDCTGCHVDHIKDNFNGSMMTNGVRDPLFRAALVVANKDAGFGGDLCIRCHSPTAWLGNRSADPNDPASTDGRFINADDLHGIGCTACHRMVPAEPLAGESTLDEAERDALGPGPFMTGNAAYIIDRNDVRRGPFDIAAAPHTVSQSSFLQSAKMCATCHDIDNPLLTFNDVSGEFELNALNTAVATTDRLFPLDRSYSEWAASSFASVTGVTGLDYPGLKRINNQVSGAITVCQDCHMPMVASKIATGNVPVRFVGQHQWVGANTSWQDGIIQVWDPIAADTHFTATHTLANKALGTDLLSRAAKLDVTVANGVLAVTITNNTGHKLPTGYGEGRRMWIEIYQLRGPTPVFTSGLTTGVGGPVIDDPYLKKYEIKLGLTEDHAQEIGRPNLAGEGFHIILNNKVFKDNRIPPRGFTNAAFAARDMQPVGVTYADGQYWDTTFYPIHPEADSISVRLMYQTASSEYIDFLASEANVTVPDAVRGDTNWGVIVDNLRDQNIGKPVPIASKNIFFPRQYVATSGTDAGDCSNSAQPCKTISYALTKAGDGGEVRVAAGVYPEMIQVSKQVSLTGGFTLTNWFTPTWTTNPTVLDGQNAYRPLTINADTVRVNGFIIRNGNATNSASSEGIGGGIFIGPVNIVDRATLVNLRLENNVASTLDNSNSAGGGLAVTMGNTFMIPARLVLTNVTVISNTATTASLGSSGGGMSLMAAGTSPLNVEMSNVTVQGNTAGKDFTSSGGGIALSLNGGTATIEQSRILNNRAAQIKTLLGGPSRGGGIYLINGDLQLLNVLIAGNQGERGNAISVQPGSNGATVSMNYVTLADNYRTAGEAAPTIHSDGTNVFFVLANMLLSDNTIAFEGQNGVPPAEIQFINSLIDNNVNTVISGTVAFSGSNPLRGAAEYVNAAAGDYRLKATSGAVDAGNGQAPLVDLDGTTRPQGVTTDIGAYEFIPAGTTEQTITFNQLPDKLVTDPPFTVNATASSNLPVSFASLTSAVCTVSGNTVTLVATGTCTIRATQAGDATFNPAPPVARSFAVKSNQKSDQTITFNKPANKQLGDPPFALSASASSGLPVSFAGNSPGVCTVSGSTVTLLAAGTCSITATQDGDTTRNPATPVTQSFTVSPPGGGGTVEIYLPAVKNIE